VKDPTKGPGWPAVGSMGAMEDVAIIGSGSNLDAATLRKSADVDKKCALFSGNMGMSSAGSLDVVTSSSALNPAPGFGKDGYIGKKAIRTS
jgi:hypothetical protein